MAYDANLILATATTVATSTTTSSTALSLRQPTGTSVVNPGGTPRRGLKARIRVTACTGTAQTVQFQLAHSDDNSNYTPLAFALGAGSTVTAPTATLTNAAGPSVLYLPFETDKPWVQLQTITTGTNVSVVYAAELATARP